MPDVIVKGLDWENKEIVGREIIESNGGEVVLVNVLRGYSTTRIIERCWRSVKNG